VVRLRKGGYTLGVGETTLLQPSIGRRDQVVNKVVNVTINDTSKKIIFKSNQVHGYMNYLKVNMLIGIDYLYSGTISNPDIQFNVNKNLGKISDKNVSSARMSDKNVSSSRTSTKINLATNIHGPHRHQSCDQSSFLQAYDKAKINMMNVKKISHLPVQVAPVFVTPVKEVPNLDMSISRLDSLLNESRDDDFEIGDNVNTIVQDIINTYNDNLLNK
jgi:hypothetical protein